MTKKLFRTLITVCLIVVLTAGLTAGAFADTEDTLYAYMVPYTVSAGDTLYSICSANGVDYDTYSSLICSFSGIKDAGYIYAGATIWLPKASKGTATEYYMVYSHVVQSGDTWYSLCNTYGMSYGDVSAKILALNGNTEMLYTGLTVKIPVRKGTAAKTEEKASTGTETGTGSTTGTETLTKTVDMSYKYLIPVTMKSGDTVSSICSTLGCDFSVYSSVIQKINGISDFRYIPVGRLIYIPSAKATSVAGSYKVVEHTVVSGDTVNNICTASGVKYAAVSSLLCNMNGLSDPSYIRVGQKLLIPVPVSGTEAEEEKTETETKTAATSSIMILNSEDGLAISLVGGVHKTSAIEGTKVTVQATPEEGKTVDKITVTGYLSGKTITVTDGSFTMPDEAVEISVSYK